MAAKKILAKNSKEYNVRYFIRILKELGIYKLWLTSRLASSRVSCHENKIRHLFDFIGPGPSSFRGLIDSSFTWTETGWYGLWSTIYNSAHSSLCVESLAINEFHMKELKNELNKFLKSYYSI